MDAPFPLQDLIEQINSTHRATFTAGNRYATGEQGAYALTDAQGQQYVLKWHPSTAHIEQVYYAQAVTEQLRAHGYPVPVYISIGVAMGGTYSIQIALSGTTMPTITARHLPHILHLQAFHAIQAPPGPREWPREIIQTVMEGGDGYCLHDSLQQHSPETASMLQMLQQVVTAYQDRITEIHEMVHFDFQAANFLVKQDTLSGVIDWEGARAGDSTFDLATLLFYGYDDRPVRDMLWEHSLNQRPIEVLSVYLAHLILRQVDWSLRHHTEAVSARYIARGQALLAEIEARL